jgi:large subunit ribosomal protein L13
MIIDGKGLILGRVCTVAAKQALLGESVNIVNCGELMVTGNRDEILASYKQKRSRGTFKGPFIFRTPEKFVKRSVRGMIPYKQSRGRVALKKVMCYRDVPDTMKDQKPVELKKAKITKVPNLKYIMVNEICKSMGGKL